MTLPAGTKLGPYEILAPLGAGGMGEVYRGRDTRLDRTVAVKVLPAHLRGDAELKQRLEREARAVSSLNHPNICTLHDIGSEGDLDYLVMEFIEGETLADRLKKGALPLDAALRIGIQVADALDRAHRSGVIHRDLKPGNIMLTKDGAKVLDFGLAKVRAGGLLDKGEAHDLTSSPTRTRSAPLTSQGLILGTLQYMAPEQLEGKPADARSDIFAFGAVLYEMVTGRRAFEGSSQASLIAAVLGRDPVPISRLQPLAPQPLERLVRACLAKDPDERRQTMRDVLLDLKWISDPNSGEASGVAALPARNDRPGTASARLAWIAALVAAGLLGALATRGFRRNSAGPRRAARAAITLPEGQSFGGSWWWMPSFALSPDGSHLAFVATKDGVIRLYIRDMSTWDARALPGTEDASTPFFSPDGQWLGAYLDGRLVKIPVAGGPAVTIAALPYTVYSATWAADGTVYFSHESSAGLLRVPAGGGTPERATALDKSRHEWDHRFPQVLADGEHVLFTALTGDQRNYDEADVYVASLRTGERHLVVRQGTNAQVVGRDRLVFVRSGVLLAAPFDARAFRLTGAPTPVVESVIENPRVGAGQYSVAADGTLAYLPGGVIFGEHELVFVDHAGNARLLTAKKRPYEDFSISPDGRFIAATIEGPETDTWIHDIARDTETRFTLGFEHRDPAWSADGKTIWYSGYKDGRWVILARSVDGTREETAVSSDDAIWPWFASRDGRNLLYVALSPANRSDIWILPLEKDGKPRPLLNTPYDEEWAQLSPDGRWLAYNSDESGRQEVYVVPFPGPGRKVRVSTEGGRHPQWSPDGKELYYRVGATAETQRALGQRSRLMAVTADASGEFRAGPPRMLFQGPFFDSGHDYAVTPDGKGFVFIRESPTERGPRELRVVFNWLDELGRLTRADERP